MPKAKDSSLLKAAALFVPPPRYSWFTRLQQFDPDLAAEVSQLADAWNAGKCLNFQSLSQLVTFVVEWRENAVGVGRLAVEKWIKERAKNKK